MYIHIVWVFGRSTFLVPIPHFQATRKTAANPISRKSWKPGWPSRCFHEGTLYQGAEVSVFEYCTLIMLFVIKHKLTKAALQDLLYLIKNVIPSIGCKMITSIYRVNGLFLNFFGNGAPTMHYMYINCGTLLKLGKTQRKSSRTFKQSGTVKFVELNVRQNWRSYFLVRLTHSMKIQIYGDLKVT